MVVDAKPAAPVRAFGVANVRPLVGRFALSANAGDHLSFAEPVSGIAKVALALAPQGHVPDSYRRLPVRL